MAGLLSALIMPSSAAPPALEPNPRACPRRTWRCSDAGVGEAARPEMTSPHMRQISSFGLFRLNAPLSSFASYGINGRIDTRGGRK